MVTVTIRHFNVRVCQTTFRCTARECLELVEWMDRVYPDAVIHVRQV